MRMRAMTTVRIRESTKKASKRIQKPTYCGSRDVTFSAMATPFARMVARHLLEKQHRFMMARESGKGAHESRAVQELGAARLAGGRRRPVACAGQGTASGFSKSERGEFPRCPPHSEQVPVQARAALLAGERDRRRGQAGRRRRARFHAGRPGDGA